MPPVLTLVLQVTFDYVGDPRLARYGCPGHAVQVRARQVQDCQRRPRSLASGKRPGPRIRKLQASDHMVSPREVEDRLVAAELRERRQRAEAGLRGGLPSGGLFGQMLPPEDDNYKVVTGMRQGEHFRAPCNSQVYENEDFYDAPGGAAGEPDAATMLRRVQQVMSHESESSDEPEICGREQPFNGTAAGPSFYGRQSANEVHQQTLDMLEDMKSKGIRPVFPPREIQAMPTEAKRQWLASVKKGRDACDIARECATGMDTGMILNATHRHFWNEGEARVAPPPEAASGDEEWFDDFIRQMIGAAVLEEFPGFEGKWPGTVESWNAVYGKFVVSFTGRDSEPESWAYMSLGSVLQAQVEISECEHGCGPEYLDDGVRQRVQRIQHQRQQLHEAACDNAEDLRQQRSLAMEGRRQEQRQLMEAAQLSRAGWGEYWRPDEDVRADHTDSDENKPDGTPSGNRDEYMEDAAGPRRGDDVAD